MREGNRQPVMLTVDVEPDWDGTDLRGVSEALPLLLELLDRRQANATFFVVADHVEAVRAVLHPDSRHEVGSHTVSHRSLRDLTAKEVDYEVGESKRLLERAGYHVSGFRAPYFSQSPHVDSCLVRHGYRYDASFGSLYPRLRRRKGRRAGAVTPVRSTTLRDGRTPFALTYLRLYHPVGLRLVPARPGVFSCHLHELVGGTAGWTRLPEPARSLHRRGSGRTAWRILEALLARNDLQFVSCRDGLASAVP